MILTWFESCIYYTVRALANNHNLVLGGSNDYRHPLSVTVELKDLEQLVLQYLVGLRFVDY